MNNTKRWLNRAFLLIVGLVLLAAGAAAILIVLWRPAADAVTAFLASAQDVVTGWIQSTPIAGTETSWVEVGALAVLILVVLVIVIALLATIRGRTRGTMRASGARNELGRVTIAEPFISDALKHSLAARDDVLSSHVSMNEVRGTTVLHVAVTPRQNTDPRTLVDAVDVLVANLATLTGQTTPTFISVRSGLRQRFATDNRRLS